MTRSNIASGRVKARRKPAGKFHHGDLRAAAVEIAVVEVEKHGYAALTLEKIASRLGVTRPALYRHFADRRALLSEVGQRGFERFEAALTEAFMSERDPWAALLAVGRAYLCFAWDNPGWFRLQFTAPKDVRPMPDLEKAPARYEPAMNAVLEQAFGKSSPEAGLAYVGLWGIVHGLSMLAVERVLEDAGVVGVEMFERALRVHTEALEALAAEKKKKKKKR